MKLEVSVKKFFCDQCRKEMPIIKGTCFFQDPISEKHICLDCAVKNGDIEPMEWLRLHGFGNIFECALYRNGEIIAFQKRGEDITKCVISVNPVMTKLERG